MDFSEIQFGNFDPEFVLTDDITGSNYQKPVFEEPSETGLPESFWFQHNSGFNFISNNDKRGMVDDKFGDTVKINEDQQVINKVYRMAMMGYSALEQEKTLKLSFSTQDFNRKTILRESLFILPMVGPIFYVCWAFKSEEESKQELRRRNGIRPVLVSSCSKCRSCQYKNSLSPRKEYCSKLGLEIFNNDFSAPPPKSVIDHLRRAEFLTSKKNEITWDDVRSAVIFPQKKEEIRIYNQVVPAKKEFLPGAQYRKKILALNKLRNEKQVQENEYSRDRLILSVYNPLIIKIQEAILKYRQNDNVVNGFIQKVVIPLKNQSECFQIIESLKQDPLLWAGIHFYLPSYQKCDTAGEFLRRNHLRIPYAIERSNCRFCIDNKSGYCKRLECHLIGYKGEIPLNERKQKIELIGSDRRIGLQLIEYCKNLEVSSQLSGLSKLREVLNSSTSIPVYDGAGIQNLDVLPNKQLNEATTQNWIEKKIKENSSILRIESSLKQVYGSKKGSELLQNEIVKLRIHPTDTNDLCLTEYQIDASTNLKKLNRCAACSYATSIYCKKYNHQFAGAFNGIPTEVEEIIATFSNSPLEVEINPINKKGTLDIFLDNPGEDISVDINVEKPLNEQKLWYEVQSQQLEVEAPNAVEFDNPLDIEMGETGEGMILDDSLL